MKFAEIKTDFENMRTDLEQFGCSIELTGGMKEKGASTNDIDVIMIMTSNETLQKIEFLLRKYNRRFFYKYQLPLHAIIYFDDGQCNIKEKLENFDNDTHWIGLSIILENAERRLKRTKDWTKFKFPYWGQM